jgi:hypothetical protein
MQPEQKSKDTAQSERASEKPSCFWQSYQPHKKQAEHYDQADWVPGQMASAVGSERKNLAWMRTRVVRTRFASIPPPQV